MRPPWMKLSIRSTSNAWYNALSVLVAAVLLFSDVAKGGTTAQRETWRHRLGVYGCRRRIGGRV